MPRLINLSALKRHTLKHPDARQWTAIIPAAGRGTRLHSTQPKILYPILGKPIAQWIISRLRPYVDYFVFVVSPEGAAPVNAFLKRLIPGHYHLTVQAVPKGMADAVWNSQRYVKTKHCVVIWGDQVNVRPQTIEACMALHEGRPNALLTFPTVERAHPYIQFNRDRRGRILSVRQAREDGPLGKARGENDCGIFFFNRHTLFRTLKTSRQRRLGIGKATGEYNLLPLIPLWDRRAGSVTTLRIKDIRESQGINTPAEAREAARVLKVTGGTFS